MFYYYYDWTYILVLVGALICMAASGGMLPQKFHIFHRVNIIQFFRSFDDDLPDPLRIFFHDLPSAAVSVQLHQLAEQILRKQYRITPAAAVAAYADIIRRLPKCSEHTTKGLCLKHRLITDHETAAVCFPLRVQSQTERLGNPPLRMIVPDHADAARLRRGYKASRLLKSPWIHGAPGPRILPPLHILPNLRILRHHADAVRSALCRPTESMGKERPAAKVFQQFIFPVSFSGTGCHENHGNARPVLSRRVLCAALFHHFLFNPINTCSLVIGRVRKRRPVPL